MTTAAAKDNGKGVVKAVAVAAAVAAATTTATAMVEKPVILMSHNTHYNTPTAAAITVDFASNAKKVVDRGGAAVPCAFGNR